MKTNEYNPVRILTDIDRCCPLTVTRAIREIDRIEIGDVIEIRTTDPGAVADFPAWAKTSGNEILELKQNAGLITIFLKRLA